MQNFDPKALAADVANLINEVADIRAIVEGRKPFNIADVAEVGEAGLQVAANFLPRLANIEAILAPLVPLLPLLQDMFKGELAGEGATQRLALAAASGDESAIAQAQAITAESVGSYDNKPEPAAVIAEAAANVQNADKPEGEADKVEGGEQQAPGVA